MIWSRCGACERRTFGARLCRQCRSALDLAYQRALMRERFPVPGLEAEGKTGCTAEPVLGALRGHRDVADAEGERVKAYLIIFNEEMDIGTDDTLLRATAFGVSGVSLSDSVKTRRCVDRRITRHALEHSRGRLRDREKGDMAAVLIEEGEALGLSPQDCVIVPRGVLERLQRERDRAKGWAATWKRMARRLRGRR